MLYGICMEGETDNYPKCEMLQISSLYLTFFEYNEILK